MMAPDRQDLITAIRDGEIQLVSEILKTTGVDDDPHLKGQLLLVAIEEDQTDIVHLLCSKGSWTNVIRSDGLSSIHVAAKYGNIHIIDTLLRKGAGVNDLSREHRLTPLLLAVRWGNMDAVLHLLDAGADPNIASARFSKLTTPLHEAVLSGNEDIIHLLLAAKADVNLTNGRRQLPLHLACIPHDFSAHVKKEFAISADGRDMKRISMKLIKRLIDCGSQVNTVDADGNTALHLAVSSAMTDEIHTNIIHLLCVNGAHIGAYNDTGDTVLHMVAKGAAAAIPGHVGRYLAITKVLLQFGADINRTNLTGYISLQSHLIVGFRQPVVDMFLSAGSNINHVDEAGESLFHTCTKTWGTVTAVRFLLRQGVNYDTVSKKKLSPLSSACITCYRPTITVLCEEAPTLLNPANSIDDVSGRPLGYVVKILDIEALRYMLASGYKWTREEIQYLSQFQGPSDDIINILKGLLEKPPVLSLAVKCRDLLRLYIKDNLYDTVNKLPLPKRLQGQLLLHDLRCYSD